MNFTSQICTTKEQSDRLLALGLKKETADMMYIALVKDYRGRNIPNSEIVYSLCTWYEENSMHVGLEKREYIPAWSLHRLLELYKSVEDTSMWRLGDITYDHLIQCIGLAIKHGGFNKEYLEE